MISEIIRYKPEHALELFGRDIAEKGYYTVPQKVWVDSANGRENSGVSLTLLINGKIEACGGVAILDPTLGECWAFLPKENNGFLVYRNMLRAFNRIIDENDFRRLHSFVAEGFVAGEKLMKGLGFELEGCLRKYGPTGENMNLYARVF